MAIANGTIDASVDGEGKISLPVDWGRYRLEIATDDPTGPVTSYEFDAGWYVAATSTETPDGLEVALDKATYAAGEVAKLKVSPRFARRIAGDDRLGDAAHHRDGHRAGRRRDGRHPGRRQLGRRRLRHRDAVPPWRRQGNAHARSRHRREMAGRRSGRQEARGLARHRCQDTAAPDALDPGLGDRAAARDGCLCDGRGGRRRHPQPDQLQGARSGSLVLRPAPARPRAARPLRPPDRRLARRYRQAPDRRRRRADDDERQSADREAGCLLLRTGAARRRRQGDGQLRHPAVQRHRPRHDGGLDQGCRRPRHART